MKDMTPIEVVVGERGGKQTFQTLDALETWIDREIEFWSWLPDRIDSFESIGRSVKRKLSDLKERVGRIRNPRNRKAKEREIDNLRSNFKAAYMTGPLINSRSTKARNIQNERDGNDAQAYGLYCFYMHSQAYTDQAYAFQGAVRGEFIKRGLRSTLDEERASLAMVQEEVTEWSSAFIAGNRGKLRELEQAQEMAAASFSSLQSQIEEQISANEQDFEQIKTDFEARIEELEDLYQKSMALKAPVKYWDDRSAIYFRGSWGFGALLIISLAIVGYLFVDYAQGILMGVRLDDGVPGYVETITLLTLATVGIWVLRVLSKIFFSQMHLWTRTKEKAVMTQAYLALESEGSITDDERSIILTSIFSNTSPGLLKSDSTLPNALTKVLSRLGPS